MKPRCTFCIAQNHKSISILNIVRKYGFRWLQSFFLSLFQYNHKLFSSLLILVCMCVCKSYGQGENNNWHFGHGHAINFNQNPPQLIQSNINTIESSSAVSDASGNLLFYTIGSHVWDKNGNEMPNSYGLLGNLASSSANGVVIIQNPGNLNQYYIFCGDAYGDTTAKLYYSMVDMTLNNGLGDVMPAIKNIVLMDNVSEQVCTTNGSDCKSSWVIVREKTTWSYNAFKIDANGVNPLPVITPPVGNLITPYITQNIAFSPDGITAASGGSCLTIEKFNNITGTFSDFILLDTIISFGTYNPEFSPDGSKLYYTYNTINSASVFQMDLSLLPETLAVINSSISITILSTPTPFSIMNVVALRRAPDGKIYTLDYIYNSSQYEQHIGRFENPNVAGSGCNFIPSIFTIQPINGLFFELGAPVFIQSPDTVFNQTDTFLCEESTMQLSSSIDSSNYIWNNNLGTSKTISISTPGIYWVNATLNGCSNTFDSFHVSKRSFRFALSNDTIICMGDTIQINASPIGLDSKLLWNTGESSSNILIDTQGIYTIIAQNVCGTFKDSVQVEMIGCYCIPFIPSAFSPNGDFLNDDFGPLLDCSNISDYSFSVYNRFGQRLFTANNMTNKWTGNFNGQSADIGSYFYYLTFRNQKGNVVSYKGDVLLIR